MEPALQFPELPHFLLPVAISSPVSICAQSSFSQVTSLQNSGQVWLSATACPRAGLAMAEKCDFSAASCHRSGAVSGAGQLHPSHIHL